MNTDAGLSGVAGQASRAVEALLRDVPTAARNDMSRAAHRCVQAFIEVGSGRRYFSVPQAAREEWARARSVGIDESEFGALLLAYAVAASAQRSDLPDLSEELNAACTRQKERILNDVLSPKPGRTLGNDEYLKDLGIALGDLTPAGPLVVELHSGLPRSLLWKGGAAQAARFAAHSARNRFRFGPYADMHVHTPLLSSFNAEGWNECYVAVAELLRLYPEWLGLLGASWFYDPTVEVVSPRLAYLRQIPRAGGALFMRMGSTTNDIANATAKSETRRKLYREGRYVPTSYVMIWPRARLLRWVNRLT